MSNLTILFSSIDLTQNREVGDTTGLQESLRRLGTIHPPVLSSYTTPEGLVRYKPVAGRRRLLSLQKNGVKELHHNSVLDPERPGFCFREDVPEDELQEATLDENLYRLKPKWQEDVLLVADIHELKRKKHGANKWGQRQTAELLGIGFSKSQVNLALKVAKLIRSGDKEVLSCETLQDATALRIKRSEDSALAEMQRRVMPVAQEGTPVAAKPSNVDSFLDSFTVSGQTSAKPITADGTGATIIIVPSLQTAPLQTAPPLTVPLSQMFIRNSCLDEEWPQVNHIVTDIPYGIDMDNLDGVEDLVATHDVEQNISMMEPFLERAFKAVKPQGFLVFCFDLDHWNYLQRTAKAIGWKVQDWPFIACKTSSCRNNAPAYNRTKNYEAIAYMRKDDKTVLREPQTSSWNTYDFAAERRLYKNKFAKPFELWKDIYSAIAFQGQSILDPFAGEASSLRAALNCGLIPYGIEIDETRYNRGVENLKAAFAVIHKNNVQFT